MKECCWPIGDPRAPDFRFCCQPVTEPDTQSYCNHHHAVAYPVSRAPSDVRAWVNQTAKVKR